MEKRKPRRRSIAHARRVLFVLLAAACAVPSPVRAQGAPRAPEGWRWLLDAPATFSAAAIDRGNDTSFAFVRMAPGWHITMGPGAVLLDPAARVDGRFVIEAEMILFPDAQEHEYGIFLGGEGLDGDATTARWTAFVVRSDGQAAVLERSAGAVRQVLPWAEHAAVVRRPPGGSARNVVTVRAELDSMRFLVNGQRVAAWPRREMRAEGNFGFRIGQGVNLHITNLDLTRRLAPVPQR